MFSIFLIHILVRKGIRRITNIFIHIFVYETFTIRNLDVLASGARGHSRRWRGRPTSTSMASGWSLYAAIRCKKGIRSEGEGNVLWYGKKPGRGLEHSRSSNNGNVQQIVILT